MERRLTVRQCWILERIRYGGGYCTVAELPRWGHPPGLERKSVRSYAQVVRALVSWGYVVKLEGQGLFGKTRLKITVAGREALWQSSFPEVVVLAHVGARPDRLSHFPEAIFSHLWKEWNLGEEIPIPSPAALRIALSGVIKHTITQRDAEVAATIIEWLGTGVGMVFLEEAKALASSKGIALQEAYRRSWYAWNHRSPGLNFGFGVLETILKKAVPSSWAAQREKNPISGRDKVVAWAIIRWLASEMGQEFIKEAERRIESENGRRSRLHHMAFNHAVISVPGDVHYQVAV